MVELVAMAPLWHVGGRSSVSMNTFLIVNTPF